MSFQVCLDTIDLQRWMISFIIPSRNRPQFLERLIRYYLDLRVKHPILIADGSSDRLRERIRPLVAELPENFSYHAFPEDSSLAAKLVGVIRYVQTRCVVVSADDDFLVPSAVERAARFLEAHPDYTVTHGAAALLVLKSGTAHGEIGGLGRYYQRWIEHSTGVERLLDHLGNYSVTAWSVHRTEQLGDNWRHPEELGLDLFFEELLPSCLSLIQGKAKKVDGLYMVRQEHPDRGFVKDGRDPFDRIADPSWPWQYERFRDRLAQELVRQDGISMNEAQEIVKQAFWLYLAQGLIRKWQGRYGQDKSRLRPGLREVSKRIPSLRTTWHTVRAFLPGEANKMSLPALLRPSSPYHADFIPIYRAVTTPSTELDVNVT